jgi:hypothetical protein
VEILCHQDSSSGGGKEIGEDMKRNAAPNQGTKPGKTIPHSEEIPYKLKRNNKREYIHRPVNSKSNSYKFTFQHSGRVPSLHQL